MKKNDEVVIEAGLHGTQWDDSYPTFYYQNVKMTTCIAPTKQPTQSPTKSPLRCNLVTLFSHSAGSITVQKNNRIGIQFTYTMVQDAAGYMFTGRFSGHRPLKGDSYTVKIFGKINGEYNDAKWTATSPKLNNVKTTLTIFFDVS